MVLKVLLSRWQFGVTITYHFLFVPLTIGLAMLVAVMQVLAYRRRDAVWERLGRFFGTLFLINFAMGIVTGIVQEFQFGMNWSNYSVFVCNTEAAAAKASGPSRCSHSARGWPAGRGRRARRRPPAGPGRPPGGGRWRRPSG